MKSADSIAETKLLDADSNEVRLGETWADGPAALVFLRHFGCSFCREHVADLSEHRAQIEAAGGRLVAVGMGTPAHADHFRRESGIGFPLLVAEDSSVHQAVGLDRPGLARVIGPQVVPSMLRALRKGHTAKLTGADMQQLGGTFVIDRDGSVLWEHRARHSGDNSSADEIVAALPGSAA